MKNLFFEYLKLRKKTRSWLGPILVFILIMIAYPLTVELLQENLQQSFYSVLWIAILIAMMMATETIFEEDFNDGTLEHELASELLFELVIGKKIFIYWTMIGIPISILSLLFSLGTNQDINISLYVFTLSLFSSYIFLNLFAFGNSLSINKGSALGAIITMPLALPILIVLGKSITALKFGVNYIEFMLLLLGCLSIIMIIMPFIISFILKAHLE